MSLHQREELAGIIARFSSEDGIHTTAIPGMNCIRLSKPNARLPSVYNPSLCVIVQGRKRVWLEDEIYDYQPSEFLVVSVDLPVIGEVTQCSDDKPYLCLQIELDQHQLAELLVQFGPGGEDDDAARTERGIFVGNMDSTLNDCVLRLTRLLDAPQDIPLLAPMIKREIYYRLLNGQFDKSVKVEELARQIGMSVSSFHAHFKTVTAMSPLQYQKRFRLLEARQIMLVEMQDAAATAYRVGYESPSHFSRDYARMFGNPPGRDINRLLAET